MADPDLTGGLTEEFGDRVPESTVASVVDAAERDLSGQVSPGAWAELVHRLARVRLRQLVA